VGQRTVELEEMTNAVWKAIAAINGQDFVNEERSVRGRYLIAKRVAQYLIINDYDPDDLESNNNFVMSLYDFARVSNDERWTRW
jgi:hypothetical protein